MKGAQQGEWLDVRLAFADLDRRLEAGGDRQRWQHHAPNRIIDLITYNL